jgi:hypothetical protein
MAKAVVEARRLAGSLGSGSGTLGLGDLDSVIISFLFVCR